MPLDPHRMATLVAQAIERAVDPLVLRVKALEAREVVHGRDADPAVVEALVIDQVTKTLAEWPRPQDGISVTLEDVQPLIASEVAKHVSAIPPAKDGLSVVGALINQDGRLILTWSDGQTKDVGCVTRTEPTVLPVETNPYELEEQASTLLRKHLGLVEPIARVQKRVIRDGEGRIERVIEEPAA